MECRDNINPNPQFGVGLEDRWEVEVESGMLVFLAGALAFHYYYTLQRPNKPLTSLS